MQRATIVALVLTLGSTDIMAQSVAQFAPPGRVAVCRRTVSTSSTQVYEFADADSAGRERQLTVTFDTTGNPQLLVVFAPDSVVGRTHAYGVRFMDPPAGQYSLLDERKNEPVDSESIVALSDSYLTVARSLAIQLWRRRCGR